MDRGGLSAIQKEEGTAGSNRLCIASEDGTPIRVGVDRQRGERLGAQRAGIYLSL